MVKFILILASILIPNILFGVNLSPIDDSSGIYFHWGDIGGNSELLRLGGSAENGEAQINDEVLNQARNWYISAGKQDVAGAGFYLTPDLFNSRQFGIDLLIIEIINDSGAPIQQADSRIKVKADLALETNDFSVLPLLTLYHVHNEKSGWRVISRPPNEKESTNVKIRFHLPRPEDSYKIWHKFEIEDSSRSVIESMNFINSIADQILIEKADSSSNSSFSFGVSNSPVTRPTEILFEQILFDYAPDYINQKIKEFQFEADLNGKIKDFRNFESIGKAFAKKLPRDPRTGKLVFTIFDKLKNSGLILKDSAVFKFFGDNIFSINDSRRYDIVDWLLKAYDQGAIEIDFASLSRIVAGGIEVANTEQKLILRKFLLSKMPGTQLKAKDYFEVREQLQKIFGAARGQSMASFALLNEVRKQAQIFSSVHIYKPKGEFPSNGKEPTKAAEDLLVITRIISELAAKNPSSETDRTIRDFIDIIYRTSPVGMVAYYREVMALDLFDKIKEPTLMEYLKTVIRNQQTNMNIQKQAIEARGYYNKHEDPTVIAFIRKFAKKAGIANADSEDVTKLNIQLYNMPEYQNDFLKGLKRVAKDPPTIDSHGPFSAYFDYLLKNNSIKGGEFEKRFYITLEAFPDQASDIAKAVERSGAYSVYEHEIDFSRLTIAAQKIADKQSNSIIKKAEEVYAEIAWGYDFVKIPRPDKLNFLTKYEHTINNILKDKDYSELSKTFILVDPLFVSEDLRLKHAAQPQLRFNEELHTSDGRSLTQPAWENFTQTWKFAAKATWWREPQLGRPSIGWLEKDLYKLHAGLIQTRVDGSETTGKFSEEWDRSKYTTFISKEDWETWDLKNSLNNLSRFFSIEEVPTGYNLKFLDEATLPKKIKGLLRYGEASYMLSYLIMKFIINDTLKLKSPIQRAARILYLTTRLHPFENGNGRFARTWAAAELMKEGYPVPVGFPTNDFMMSQRHIELEVRKAVKLGQMWEQMLSDASKKGISTDEFFQKVYRGSALEGLSHISPVKTKDLESYVVWLESQSQPPLWAADFMRDLERRLYEMHSGGGVLATISESERSQMVAEAWEEFRGKLEAKGLFKLSVIEKNSIYRNSNKIYCSELF